MSKSCFIYIISISGTDLRKVGISENPRSRLAQLCTGSPFPMRIERTFPLSSRDEALKVERRFHERRSQDKTNGEWVNLDMGSTHDCVISTIAELVAEEYLSNEAFEISAIARGLSEDEVVLYGPCIEEEAA